MNEERVRSVLREVDPELADKLDYILYLYKDEKLRGKFVNRLLRPYGLEYAVGSRKMAGYYRRISKSQFHPMSEIHKDTRAQIDARLRALRTGYEAFGKKDIRDEQGKVVKKRMTEEVKKATKGYKSPYRKPPSWKETAKMIKKMVIAVGKRVEEREIEVKA